MDGISIYNDDIVVNDDIIVNDDIPIINECIDTEPESTCTFTDKLSLELLMNKSHYRKYIEKYDPNKHDEYQEYLYELTKYKNDIIEIVSQLTNEPDTQYNSTINSLFNDLSKAIIEQCKHKHVEQLNQYNDDGQNDVIFTNMNTRPFTKQSSHIKILEKSFWGKSANFNS